MNDKAPDAFQPITGEGNIQARLKARAEQPDLWAAKWPDDSRLLAARDRFSRILTCYCHWPNAFFLPDDHIYVLLDAGDFESLDLVELIITLEEMFDIKTDDEMARKMPISYRGGSTYGQLLKSIVEICGADKDIAGIEYKWTPFSPPPDYFASTGAWQGLKRYLTDGSLKRVLRQVQVARPQSWKNQWDGFDNSLIQLRDRVGRILIDEFEWFDEAFIPQDRLEAVFHSRRGLRFAAKVLEKINREFQNDIEFDFITSGRHTYADFLKRLAGNSSG